LGVDMQTAGVPNERLKDCVVEPKESDWQMNTKITAVEQSIFLIVLTYAIDYFNHALIR